MLANQRVLSELCRMKALINNRSGTANKPPIAARVNPKTKSARKTANGDRSRPSP
jgi:hypothetical protein